MFYQRDSEDEEEDDIVENMSMFAHQLQKQTNYHTKKILEEDTESVELFLNEITRLLLEKVNEVENDDVALDLTTLITAGLGGIGTALLELKGENEHYKEKVINYIAKKQNPETN